MSVQRKTKRVAYRKLAFAHYQAQCVHCGFGIKEVLEVAHIDCNRQNNDISNLVILCPTCHRMHDIDLISTKVIRIMRDRKKIVRQSKRMKGARIKAVATRRKNAEKRKWHMAGIKAAKTRARNKLKP